MQVKSILIHPYLNYTFLNFENLNFLRHLHVNAFGLKNKQIIQIN